MNLATPCVFVSWGSFFLVSLFLKKKKKKKKKACRREINAAIRVTIRRATPRTADHVFMGVLREKIENRLNRREADKLRKRRTRQLAMGVAT